MTINGVGYSLAADRTWSVGTVTSVGTSAPLTGGTITGSGTIGISQSNTTTDGYLSSTDWNTFNNKQANLGYTPENLANKGINNGYASLGGDGKVPSTQLPSYVDDVVEVANFAALPATGETGKIYVTLDTDFVYRWSGTVYVRISSPNAIWGSITGTLSNQIDLQNALNAKVSSVGLDLGTSGTDVNVANSPITSSGNITLNLPTASATNRGLLSSADWTTFNNKQNALTLTTTGTSGASTLVGSTLNIPQYQPQLSGTGFVKISGTTISYDNSSYALASAISGTTNYIPKFTGANTIGNSIIFDNGTNVGIGINNPANKLTIVSSGGNPSINLYDGTTDCYLALATSINAYANGTSAGDTVIRGGSGISFSSNGGVNLALRLSSTGEATFNGNTSIGYTTNPNLYKLDVNGIIRGTGNAYFGGNVGIGTTSLQASYKVTISGTDSIFPSIYLENTTNSQAYSIRATGTDFVVRDNTSGNDRFTIESTGAATFRSSVATTGVVFPATQVASADPNTLDDYEEGTWTPQFEGCTFTGSVIATYTKIGRQVTVQLSFVNRSISNVTSQARIASLPFTSTDAYQAGSIAYADVITTNGSIYVQNSGTIIYFLQDTGTTAASWNAGTNNRSLMLTVTYFTA